MRRRTAPAAGLAVVTLVTCAVVGVAVAHRGRTAPTAPADVGASAPTLATTRGTKSAAPHGAHRRHISLDLHAHSTTDPSSIWVVVNKTHPISPLDFRPELGLVRGYQVAPPAVTPLQRLLAAGDRAALGLKIASAFRSYGYQEHVHDTLVASEGTAEADRVSARPGYSEHQTGLAVDLVTPARPGCDLSACFATTPAGRWLAANAWRFGFIVRYTASNQGVTGYQPEPWHLRYVGRPLAAAMRTAHITTLERVFHVGGGTYR